MDNTRRESKWNSKLTSHESKMDNRPTDKVSVDFDLDLELFGDEDDDHIIAQAYDESIGRLEEYHAKPGSSSSRPNNHRILESLPGFDCEAGKTWVYPLNYPLREYQHAIVEQALFKNTLVSLPTGLGKTFIAAVVMYNFYRWYPNSKIIFMAPTKPLVAQQVEACFNVVGIPQVDISQMTGSMHPDARVEEWKKKRLFFLTPQVLTNDFVRGACPAGLIKCLVLDEAHRATGNHAYCQVVRELRQRHCEFRVLALSATPGSDMNAVKQVLTNLLISHIELRSEDSPDITPYSHHRSIEKVVVPLGEELTNMKNKYLNILRIYVNRLLDLKVLFTRDETTLSKYQVLQARDAFRQNPPENLPRHRFGAVEGLFALCVTLYHAFDLMLMHGTRTAYKFLKGTLGGDKGKSFARAELLRNDIFKRLMDELSKKFEGELDQTKTSNSSFGSSTSIPQISNTSIMNTSKESYTISHPKMEHLCKLVVDHHQKNASEGNSTRIMIFSQYRDSVLEITEMLHHHEPLVKAMSFVGQGSINRGTRGISQKEQLRVIKQFKEGGFNTLVSTCVGEEGLDIGDVDLIVCYDAPKSPIRLVQRMGRTGRKREGRIVVLVTKGKEEQSYNQSQYQKKMINTALANKEKLNCILYSNSARMVPVGITPVCQKLHMKVDAWETLSKKSKKKSKSPGSSSCRFSSQSNPSRKEMHGFLSEEEWNWYKENLWVPHDEVNVLPKPSLRCLNHEEIENNCIELGSYQPWQTSLQRTHLFGHSVRAQHLVQLTEFVDLQDMLEEGEDPYGLEMAAFLDMSYVRDETNQQQFMAPSPKVDEDKKGSKKKSKKSQVDKNKQVKNNALITSMFARISSGTTTKAKGSSQTTVANVSHDEENSGKRELKELADDDIVVLDDEDDDFLQSNDDNNAKCQKIISPKVSPSKESRHDLQVASSNESRRDHQLASSSREHIEVQYADDEFVQLNKSGSSSASISADLPPPGSVSPLHIRTPPDICSPKDGDMIEDPVSPSDVMMAIDDWAVEKSKTSLAKYCIFNNTVSDCLVRENRTLADVNVSKELTSNSVIIWDSYDEELPDFGVVKQPCDRKRGFAFGKMSVSKEPVSVVVYAQDSEFVGKSTIIDCDDESKGYDSSIEADVNTIVNGDADGLLPAVNEVSPILSSSYRQPMRTNLKVCSSTPKVNARRLFKVATPDLTVIEKNSMLHIEESCSVTPKKEQIVMRKANEANENVSRGASTPGINTLRENTKARIRSKLSRFSIPSNLESVPEISAVINKEGINGENTVKGKISVMNNPTDDSDKADARCFEECDVGVPNCDDGASTVVCSELNLRRDEKIISQKSICLKNGELDRYKNSGRQENEFSTKKEFVDLDKEKDCVQKSEKNFINQSNTGVSSLNDSTSEMAAFKISSDMVSDKCSSSPEEVINNTPPPIRPVREKDPVNSFKKKWPILGQEERPSDNISLKDKLPSDSYKKDSSLSDKAMDRVNFDLSLDDDIFAELDMNDYDKKEASPAPSELGKSDANVARDSSRSDNVIQHRTQRSLLSVTQIIDLVDQVDTSMTRNNRSSLSRVVMLESHRKKSTKDSLLSSRCVEASLEENCRLLDGLSKGNIDTIDKPLLKKPSLLSRTTKPEKKTEDVLCPNFSLMDGIDFDMDDDLVAEDPQQPASVNFDLLGTEEFEPVISDQEDGTKSSSQNKSLTKSRLVEFNAGKSPSGPLGKWKASNTTESFGEDLSDLFLSKVKEPDNKSFERTPKRLSSDLELSVRYSSAKKKSLLKSPNSIPLSQDTAHVWKRRERKACNVVGSDEDRSFHDSESENSHSKNSLCTSGPNASRENVTYVDDDDDDFKSDAGMLYRQPVLLQKPVVENNKKKKPKWREKANQFIDNEADVSCDSIVVSSDESEREDEYENNSFVDDCTQLSQDPAVDIKAVYLKSILSPVKNPRNQRQLPPVVCLSDTEELTDEQDESEDSFVVDNDVVEYNTEYMGESMLAEDSIMLQALEDNFNCNKNMAAKDSQKNKRKRIILNDSSSEEENEQNKKVKGHCVSSEEIKGESNAKKQCVSNARLKEQRSDSSSNRSQVPEIVNMQVNTGNANKKLNCDQTMLNSVERESRTKLKQTFPKALPVKSAEVSSYTNHSVKPREKSNITKGKNKDSENSEGFEVTPASEGEKSKHTMKKFDPSETFRMPQTAGKAPEKKSPVVSQHLSNVSHSAQTSSRQVAATSPSTTEKPAAQSQIPGLVLVDSHEVNGGGNIVSRLKLHHGLNTAVVQLVYGHYAVSTRMTISRLQLSVFSNSNHRDALKKRVQGMLATFDRSVIIVELDRPKHGDSPYNVTHVRSKYIDTITCACAQVTQLKLLYSNDQDETARLISQLVEQERTKGYNIPVLPAQVQQWQQVISIYRSLPRISYVTALCLARNYKSLQDFFNSSVEAIQEKGCMSHQRATEVHQLINRSFREDMLLQR